MPNPDRYFLGNEEHLLESPEERESLIQRLRQYLDLRNVAVLIGNGASIPLGSPSIGNVRGILDQLTNSPCALSDAAAQAEALALLDVLVRPDTDDRIGVEPLLGTLAHLMADYETLPKGTEVSVNGIRIKLSSIRALERLLKKWLFEKCMALGPADLDSGLASHRELLRRFLLRAASLPRLRIFTTNYDLLIEKALDQLGVWYFDGFVGTVERKLRSESYHYDLYFPGETTEGRVSRVERVVQLYKLHGSINWKRAEDGRMLDVVVGPGTPSDAEFGQVMIYPSPLKVTEMNGYPYSEMFRHFASLIHQAQSVLFTIGYSFSDDHINRIIYQALSIPSFVLVIVLPTFSVPQPGIEPGREHEVWRLINRVSSKRIVVITGGLSESGKGYVSGAGTLRDFSKQWMPDISELDIEAKVRDEVKRALDQDGR